MRAHISTHARSRIHMHAGCGTGVVHVYMVCVHMQASEHAGAVYVWVRAWVRAHVCVRACVKCARAYMFACMCGPALVRVSAGFDGIAGIVAALVGGELVTAQTMTIEKAKRPDAGKMKTHCQPTELMMEGHTPRLR